MTTVNSKPLIWLHCSQVGIIFTKISQIVILYYIYDHCTIKKTELYLVVAATVQKYFLY